MVIIKGIRPYALCHDDDAKKPITSRWVTPPSAPLGLTNMHAARVEWGNKGVFGASCAANRCARRGHVSPVIS